MGRLTNVQGIPIKCLECEDNGNCDYWCHAYDECAKKLKEYEDLEKEGLLLRIPCKIGDIVYIVGTKCLADVVSDQECSKFRCDFCKYDKEYVVFDRVVDKYLLADIVYGTDSNFLFGITVFLTQYEAEEKLKELSK